MFCSNPFQRMDIHDDGGVYCCCSDWLPMPIGNALERSLVEIWRGDKASEIRASILDGSFRHCSACPYLTGKIGGPVVPGEGSESDRRTDRIGILKLDYDRACNLACPSCRTSHYSDALDGDKSRRIQAAVIASGAVALADQIYMSGWGDPLASPVYREFLREIPRLAKDGLPKLFLHTNGLLLDEAHWRELGPAADLVEWIGISIDAATEETYRMNRGGSWHRLWNNIAFIVGRRRPDRILRLKTFFTFQANNFREMKDFVTISFGSGADHIAFSALHNWGTFTPEEYARRAVHLPAHPEHGSFLAAISDPIFDDWRISMITR
jgi:MoaA/NifB/PqqE/SkfB family radical SAM enzyme